MCWLSVLMGTLTVQRLLVNLQDAQEKRSSQLKSLEEEQQQLIMRE